MGSKNAQLFQGEVRLVVEITSIERPRTFAPHSKSDLPGTRVPEVKQVATKQFPETPNATHPVELWISDSSTMTGDPKAFKPGTPTDPTPMGGKPTVKDLLADHGASRADRKPTPAKAGKGDPIAPKLLHVEAFTGAEHVRDMAVDVVNRAAKDDTALTLPGTPARAQIDTMFSAENIEAALPKLLESGVQEQGLKYGRRFTARSGSLGMTMGLSNPKLVSISDHFGDGNGNGTENASTGGAKASAESSKSKSVDATAGANVVTRKTPTVPEGEPAPGTTAVGVGLMGQYTPWSEKRSSAVEVSGTVDRNVVTPGTQRTVLVQLDADVSVVAESRAGNALYHGGTPNTAGATTKLPGAVFVRVTEAEAREMGVLPKLPEHVPAEAMPEMRPPKSMTTDGSSALGLGAVENGPDLSAEVNQLIEQLNRETSRFGSSTMVPDTVMRDLTNNFQRLTDFTSPTSVQALIDGALDGGVPLLLHQPGTFGKDTYQVTLKAKPAGEPKFVEVVNDGVDVEHTVTGAVKQTTALTNKTGWSLSALIPGINQPGTARPNAPGTVNGAIPIAVTAHVAHTQEVGVSNAKTEQEGNLRAATGPAARYVVPVEFELVVEKGANADPVASVKSGPQDISMRLHADNQRVTAPPAKATPAAGAGAPQVRTAADAQPDAIADWRGPDHTSWVPRGASVENFRGAEAVRDAAVEALTKAGAGKGLTGKGTGSLNVVHNAISSEVLQPGLPGVFRDSLTVPTLHETSVFGGKHADVKVYARVVERSLNSLSESVNLENPKTSTWTTNADAKTTNGGDVGLGVGGGARFNDTVANNTELGKFGGLDVKHATESDSSQGGGHASGTTNNVKNPGNLTALVDYDVEYRVVATVDGRTSVVDVTVPDSVSVRMLGVDVPQVLGTGIDPVMADAQSKVKAAAGEWRTAELAVEKARHDAQDKINEVAPKIAELANARDGVDVRGAVAERDGAIRAQAEAHADVPVKQGIVNTRQEAVTGLETEVAKGPGLIEAADAKAEAKTRAAREAAEATAAKQGELRAAQEALRAAEADIAAKATAAQHPDSSEASVIALSEAVLRRPGLQTRVDELGAEVEALQGRQTEAEGVRDGSRAEADRLRQQHRDDVAALGRAREALGAARTELENAEGLATTRDSAAETAAKVADERAAQVVANALRTNLLKAQIAKVEATLATERAKSDVKQLEWWQAKRDVEAKVDAYNAARATPPTTDGGTPPAPPACTVVETPAPVREPEGGARGAAPARGAPKPGETGSTTTRAGEDAARAGTSREPRGTDPISPEERAAIDGAVREADLREAREAAERRADEIAASTTDKGKAPADPIPPAAPPRAGRPDQPGATPPATDRSADHRSGRERAWTGVPPEASFDVAPGGRLDDAQLARIDARAAELTESAGKRAANGWLPPVVAVDGAHAAEVASRLRDGGVDAQVLPGGSRDGADVRVDYDLRRADGWTPPQVPRGEVDPRAAQVKIDFPDAEGAAWPTFAKSVLEDTSWRNSAATSAPWFDAKDPATPEQIAHVLTHATPLPADESDDAA
ncbi:hypothetical protein [Actinosynnema sp.]|uniref:hypothetical protein n=1 Tax=Actinosynnema sp. TaxID=1872144 RepID=UPI003F870E61